MLCWRSTASAAFKSVVAKDGNDDGQFYVRYCFADPAHADEFCDRFGGERMTAKLHRQARSGYPPIPMDFIRSLVVTRNGAVLDQLSQGISRGNAAVPLLALFI